MPNDMDCRAERKRPIATVLPITSGSMSKSMRVRGIRRETMMNGWLPPLIASVIAQCA